MKHKNIKNNRKQSGQALLFVIVALTIALSVGISASVRTLTSLSRTTRTDTATRAISAAEGGIERYLNLSSAELEDAISGTCPLGGTQVDGACSVEFNTAGVISEALVSVEKYTPSEYHLTLADGEVKEVNLYDHVSNNYYGPDSLQICWTPDGGSYSTISYLSYNENVGIQWQQGIRPPSGSAPPYSATGFSAATNAASASPPRPAYSYCYTGNLNTGSQVTYGVRIRSFVAGSKVGIYPVSPATALPLQGYKITSVGTLQTETGVTATRKVSVVRTLPYIPASLDYGIYSVTDIIK